MGCLTDVLTDTDAAAEGTSSGSTLVSCVEGPAGGLADGPAGRPTLVSDERIVNYGNGITSIIRLQSSKSQTVPHISN